MAESDGTTGPDEPQPEAAKDESAANSEREASSSEPELPAVQVIKPANASRPSKPGKRPKAGRKRQQPLAANTLQSGAALQNTWKVRSNMPTGRLSGEGAEAQAASDQGGARSETDASGVHTVGADEVEVLPSGTRPPPSIRAHETTDDDASRPAGRSPSESDPRMDSPRVVAALADTQQDDSRLRSQHQQRAARSGRLARTLRMELKLGSGAPEPPPAAVPDAYGGRHEERHDRQDRPMFIGGAQRIGGSDSSEFMSGRPPLHNTDPMGTPSARQHRGLLSDPRLQQQFTISAREASSAPPPLPRRHSRPGERTMILTRRAHVATKDWMFVGLLVAALGVTASMLWSYRSQSGSEAAANEEPSGDDTGATTVEHAMTADNNANDAPAAQAAAAAVRATELRSDPVGAEVVASGAVVGNTPVRVARGGGDVDYTLRMSGYEPQRVRVGANSPATIHVTLQPKAAAAANAVTPRDPGTGPALPQPSAAARVPATGEPAAAAAAAVAPAPSAPAASAPSVPAASAPAP